MLAGILPADHFHRHRLRIWPAVDHPNHPDGNYQMANRVQVFDPPRATSWKPGHDSGDGSLRFGGWVWRYGPAASI
jgi:hypothetical protein